jgi:hypothetical protein
MNTIFYKIRCFNLKKYLSDEKKKILNPKLKKNKIKIINKIKKKKKKIIISS